MKRIRSAIRTLLCSLWFVIATIIIALLVYLNIHRRTEPMTTVGGGGGEPRHSSPYLPNMGNQRVTGMNAQMLKASNPEFKHHFYSDEECLLEQAFLCADTLI